MKFVDAIKTCLSKYATFEGRAGRPEFWWFMLFCMLAISLAEGFVGEGFSGLVTLAVLVPTFAVSARRLHDIGRTGWWQLLLLSGIGFLVLLYWWVQPGEGAGNIYGEPSAA